MLETWPRLNCAWRLVSWIAMLVCWRKVPANCWSVKLLSLHGKLLIIRVSEQPVNSSLLMSNPISGWVNYGQYWFVYRPEPSEILHILLRRVERLAPCVIILPLYFIASVRRRLANALPFNFHKLLSVWRSRDCKASHTPSCPGPILPSYTMLLMFLTMFFCLNRSQPLACFPRTFITVLILMHTKTTPMFFLSPVWRTFHHDSIHLFLPTLWRFKIILRWRPRNHHLAIGRY